MITMNPSYSPNSGPATAATFSQHGAFTYALVMLTVTRLMPFNSDKRKARRTLSLEVMLKYVSLASGSFV